MAFATPLFGLMAVLSEAANFYGLLGLPVTRGEAASHWCARLSGRSRVGTARCRAIPPLEPSVRVSPHSARAFTKPSELGRQYFYCLGDSRLQVPNIPVPLAQLIPCHSIRSAEDADTGRTTTLLSSICILTCCLRKRTPTRRRISPPAGINAFPAGEIRRNSTGKLPVETSWKSARFRVG